MFQKSFKKAVALLVLPRMGTHFYTVQNLELWDICIAIYRVRHVNDILLEKHCMALCKLLVILFRCLFEVTGSHYLYNF